MPYQQLDELMEDIKAALHPTKTKNSILDTTDAIIEKIRATDTDITKPFIFAILEKNQHQPVWCDAYTHAKTVKRKLSVTKQESKNHPSTDEKPLENLADAIKKIKVTPDNKSNVLALSCICLGLQQRHHDLDSDRSFTKIFTTKSLQRFTGKSRSKLFQPIYDSICELIQQNSLLLHIHQRHIMPAAAVTEVKHERKPEELTLSNSLDTLTKKIRSLTQLKESFADEMSYIDFDKTIAETICLNETDRYYWESYSDMRKRYTITQILLYTPVYFLGLTDASMMQTIRTQLDSQITLLTKEKEKKEALEREEKQRIAASVELKTMTPPSNPINTSLHATTSPKKTLLIGGAIGALMGVGIGIAIVVATLATGGTAAAIILACIVGASCLGVGIANVYHAYQTRKLTHAQDSSATPSTPSTTLSMITGANQPHGVMDNKHTRETIKPTASFFARIENQDKIVKADEINSFTLN